MSVFEDYMGIYTYRNPLILYKIENLHSWEHREFVLAEDNLIKIYITKLDEECFEELPVFEPDITDQIKEEWQYERFSDLLIRMMDLARIHRWCIVTLYDEDPYWRVYSEREVDVIEYEGEIPISAKIRGYKELPRSQTQHDYTEDLEFGEASPSTFVKFGKPIGRYIAESDLQHVWTLITELRYIKEDIVRNSAKSSGFYFIKLGPMAAADDDKDMERTMGKANYGNAVAAKVSKIEDIIAVHPENCQFSIDAKTRLMKDLAGACRVPLSFFNSETEKAGMGMENRSAEEMLINKKKKYIFSQFKTAMMEIIQKRWGITLTDIYPYIEETEEETHDEDVIEDEDKNKNNNNQGTE